jgi:type IV pilus assembly protein PilM
VDGRLLWPEMLTALDQCLPSDPPEKRPNDLMERNEIHIQSLQCEWFLDLSTWYNAVRAKIEEQMKDAAKPEAGAAQPPAAAEGGAPGAPLAAEAAPVPPGGAPADAAAVDPSAAAATPDPGPSGAGWVIQLRGYHYHNKPGDVAGTGPWFVRRTLIENLRNKKVTIADKDGKPAEIAIKDLGIGYPVITSLFGAPVNETINVDEGNQRAVKRWDFTLQFAWKPTPLGKRLEQKQNEQGQAAPAFAGQGGGP